MFNCLCKTQVVCVNLMQKVVELFSESHIQNIVTVVYMDIAKYCEIQRYMKVIIKVKQLSPVLCNFECKWTRTAQVITASHL